MDIRRFGRREEGGDTEVAERYRICRERERVREIVRTDTNRDKLVKINR